MNTLPGGRRALFLSTTAFAVAFAVWGLLSGLAPIFKQQYGLSATQVSLMVAIPVILGSIGRLPMGLLADRYGAKPILVGLLLFYRPAGVWAGGEPRLSLDEPPASPLPT